MRFLTITPNPAVDTTYLLGSLTPGAINRVERVLPVAGGKGNNVAKILAALGHTPTATGFVGGHTGTFIEDGLRDAGVDPRFVPVAGASRICLTIVEQSTGQITEIREPGHSVSADESDRLLGQIEQLAPDMDVAIISGSLPPGLTPEFTADVVRTLKRHGVFVALDSSGEALRRGLAGHPDLIKPNRDELTELIGPVADRDELVERVQSRLIGNLLTAGATVLVSLGAEGALLIKHDRAITAKPPAIDPVNSVGSGDALLAGFLNARARGRESTEALGWAVATGTAAALQEAVGTVDRADIERLFVDVIVETMPTTLSSFPYHHDSRQRCAPR